MINRLMALLLDELRAEGIPSPLTEQFALAATWDDLARLAGETPPIAVRQLSEDDGLPAEPSVYVHYPTVAAPGAPSPILPS